MVQEMLYILQAWLFLLQLCWSIGICQTNTEQPQLTSLAQNGSGVYLQQHLVLRCQTCTSLLVWRSYEYLNMNWEEMTFTPGHLDHHDQRITFPPNSVPGDIGSVVAVLNNITNECIQSSLEIVVSDVHPNFTVSCHGRDSGVVSRMIFHYNDGPAVKVAAENNVTCINTDVCIDCEVRDSVTLQLMFRGETINCTHNSSSNYISQIHDRRVSVHKTYSTDSNGTSLLKCSVRMNTEGLPTNVLLPINCLNVDIGTSSNNLFMVSQDCQVTTTSKVLITMETTTVSKASATVGVYHTGTLLLSIFIPLLPVF